MLEPFTSKHYSDFVDLYNLIHEDSPKTKSEHQHFFNTRASDMCLHEVLYEGETMLAVVLAMKADDGVNRKRFDLYIRPDKQTPELLKKLYEHALRQVQDAQSLVTRVREDWSALRSFFETEGFTELEHMWESKLSLEGFNSSPFGHAEEKALAAGISFKTMADLPNTLATQEMIYATIPMNLLKLVPVAEPLNIWPFELWLARYWNSPQRNPESNFLAFSGSELVGYSELYKTDDPSLLRTGLTAVKTEYQRKGIALSLKLKAIAYAKSHSVKTIVTHNHSINRPMLSINEALGFKKDPAWIRLKKEL